MKVKELMLKAHLYGDQKITVVDHSTQQTFTTKDRYAFEMDSDEVERIIRLKVNSYNVNEKGICIYAE